ncbi:hypothetical protein [uncultured Draconibacterium sp.]|uniref:hypothetical protein n=1 Tax=uncultured Draconibacterium sp. TaxID=1573823 RepID=UPI002AA91217|nr:hypothetical protein [uncultured Draconibacterium sp.]
MNQDINIILSKLDWSTIFLFSKVKDNLIDKIIKRWIKEIEQGNSVNLKWNLLAGFLNVFEMLDSKVDFENEEKLFLKKHLKGVINDSKSFKTIVNNCNPTLIFLLKERGYLLFNFYLYKIIDAFGEKYLNPVVIGFEHIRNSHDNYNNIYSALNNSKIPFRLFSFDKFLNTYKNQLLPIHGGLTPYYTLKNFKSPNPILPYNVTNFLLHFSTLHKREDYVQGHFSALLKVIKNYNGFEKKSELRPIFSSVLTSILPYAFNEDDVQDFDKALNEIELLGNFSEFEQLSSIQDHQIKSVIIETDDNLRVLDQTNDFVNDFNLLFQKDINNNLLYIYTEINEIKKSDEKGKSQKNKQQHLLSAFALNIDSIENVVTKLFPSGPWFETNIFYKDYRNDYKELINYITLIKDIFIGKNQTNKNLCSPLSKFFNVLFPMAQNEEIYFQKEVKNFQVEGMKYSLICFFNRNKNPNNNWNMFSDKFIKIIKKTLKEQIKNLEGDNPILVDLQEDWIKFNKANNDQQDFKHAALDLIIPRDILNEIRAIFVVEHGIIHIPEQNESNIFFQSYQEYWTFQKILSKIFYENINIEEFDKFQNTAKQVYLNENSNVRIVLGKNNRRNQLLKRAILYYGIEIRDLERSDEKDEPVIELRLQDGNIEVFKDFKSFYKAYIIQKLNNSNNSDILKSIFGQNINSITMEEIEELKSVSVELNVDQNVEKSIWKPHNVINPKLIMINYMDLVKSYENKERVYNEMCDSCDELKCSSFSCRWDFNSKKESNENVICSLAKKYHALYIYNHRNWLGNFVSEHREKLKSFGLTNK